MVRRTLEGTRKLIPEGATAGTTVVGASVGEPGVSVGEGVIGEGVPAKTHAQRWTARQKADVSTRRVPLRWSQFAESSRAVPCAPLAMWHTTLKMHSATSSPAACALT
jgi:hypothetical protein